jgi:hypothetical protein
MPHRRLEPHVAGAILRRVITAHAPCQHLDRTVGRQPAGSTGRAQADAIIREHMAARMPLFLMLALPMCRR